MIVELFISCIICKISHKMLKIAPEKIAEPLQIIFSKSLRQGKYPSSWKIAHVIAILKKVMPLCLQITVRYL